MSPVPMTKRPLCVLGTPACPTCNETGMVSKGGFLTCATCGLTIMQLALLRDLNDRAAAVED